jgi:membrane protein
MNTPETRGPKLLELSKHSIRSYLKHDMPSYAATLAYRALFALFPLFGLLVTLIALLAGNSFFDWLIGLATSALQEQYAVWVEQWINQIQDENQGTLLSISIVSIGLALWSISSGFRSLTKALNVTHDVKESRPSWKRYPLSFFYACTLPIIIILSSGLLLIGPQLVAWVVGLVGLDEVFISLWTWLRLPVALVLIMLAVSIIYWAIPNVNHRYRLITPGAALAVISWVIASLGFSFYLANFANYSVIYGSLGAAFALLLYFDISAIVLLFGAEVNATIHHYASVMKREQEECRTNCEAQNAEERSREDS